MIKRSTKHAIARARDISLRDELLRLVALSVIPLVLIFAGTLYQLATQRRQLFEDQVLASALKVAALIDEEAAQVRVVAETLAQTTLLGRLDLNAAQAAARAVATQRPGLDIALIAPDGQQLFNSAQDFGTALGKAWTSPAEGTGLSLAQQALRDQLLNLFAHPKAEFSDLYEVAGSSSVVAYRMPIVRGGNASYLLVVVLQPQRLAKLLQAKTLRAGGTSTLLDRRNVVLASTAGTGLTIGQTLADASIAQNGLNLYDVYRGSAVEGRSVVAAFVRSDQTGWLIRAVDAGDASDVSATRALWIWVTIVLLLVGVAIAVAWRTWRQIGEPLRLLSANAHAFERGEPVTMPSSRVREVRDCGRAWALAVEATSARHEQERRAVIAEARQHEAEQVSREKDRVLAALGHELRNPLAGIVNGASVLERTAAKPPEALAVVAMIKRQSLHLARLVDDLLDLASATFGKMSIERHPAEVFGLVQRVASEYETRAVTGAKIRLSGQAVWVDGDATRLAQVLRNIIENAIKFTPVDGLIDISVRQEKANAVIKAVDSGAGMPAELLETAFAAFVQNPQTPERTQGGLGLGLALVRAITELHGGRASVHSDGVGQGTTITIELPCRT